MKTFRNLTLGVALLAAGISPARAEDRPATDLADTNLMGLSFDQLLDINVEKTSTASRYQQTLAQAPASVSIVTHDEIKKLGHRTLAEILSGVRGLYVAYDRNYTYLGVRGFNRPGDYNSRVLVLVDGQRVNDGVYDAAPLGTDFPVDVDMIDRVEVVRGPSSAVYGNNAFFGVVNVITRRGAQVEGGEASFSGGSWETWRGRFSLGKKFKNEVELLVSGSILWSEGQSDLYYPEFNTPSNNVHNGKASHLDIDHAHNYLATLNYHDWTLEGIFSSREKTVPTGAYGTDFNDARFKTTDERALLDLKYHHVFNENTEVNAKTYYDHYDFIGDYPTAGVVTRDHGQAEAWGGEYNFARHLGKHTLSAGVELREYFKQDQTTVKVMPFNPIFDHPQNEFVVGGYAQANVQLLKQLTLDAGGRFDYFERFGSAANPRLALIYQPVETTTLKALYGTAFRAPNAYELYYVGTGYDTSARDLKPEEITTYEGIVEQQITKWLRFSASGFYYEVDRLLAQVVNPGNGLLTIQNLDNAIGYGAEFELEARHHSGA
ncbi:MAG: hypothetical protein RL616_2275, partial [Verrucomicrobiota bacterium]